MSPRSRSKAGLCDFCRTCVDDLKTHQQNCAEYAAWALAPEKYWRTYWTIRGNIQITIFEELGYPLPKQPTQIRTYNMHYGATLGKQIFSSLEEAKAAAELRLKRKAARAQKELELLATLEPFPMRDGAREHALRERPLLEFDDETVP